MRNVACIWTALWPGADTEHDPDVLIVDLDPPHQGADEVALGGPIRLAQPIADHGCEDLQLADDELQRARLVGVRAALTKCPSEAAGLSGRGGARVYRGGAFFGLVHDELGKAKGCSQWSSTDGFATPAMSRG